MADVATTPVAGQVVVEVAGNAAAAQAWRSAYERVATLVEETEARDPEALGRTVPACPGWTARELVAHMVGVDHDVLADEVDDEMDETWTQKHVDQRSGRSTREVLAEWAGLADDVETFVRETDDAPLGDVVIHEQDLRGALGTPGARDDDGLAAVRDLMASQLGERLDGRGPVRLEATDTAWSWQSGEGDPDVVLRAGEFDLARALTSRRTADQLRSWATGDVGPYLDDFAGLGPLPEQELPE